MNWSSLLPSSLNPQVLLRQLTNSDHNLATQALRDMVILIAFSLAGLFALLILGQVVGSWFRTRPYLKLTKKGKRTPDSVAQSDRPLCRELRHHLIDFPSRDGSNLASKRRTVDASEVFSESVLGPGFSSSRLFLAIPSILTGLGVLGTFVGLQLGIGSLDFDDLEKSIRPLIKGCAVAFSSSVWGVGASLLFSFYEKLFEAYALGRVHKIQVRIDALFPRYVPEEALHELERTSRGTEDLLKGLAVAIGDQMQQAIGRLGSEIKDAVSNATAEGHAPLMEKSAEVLSSALTTELARLKEQIAGMGEQFSSRFSGASDELLKSVQGFQPTVEALSSAVGESRRAVTDAVGKLTAHEGVMQEMASAAANVRIASEAFGAMNETLRTSSQRNEEASKAQLSATAASERVVGQFGSIGEQLPRIGEMVHEAARVIGSLGAPIAEMKTLLEAQPELQKQVDNHRATSESERSQALLAMSSNLAEKVGAAAQQFAQVGELAEKLSSSSSSLESVSKDLAVFANQVSEASKDQRDASEASRAAAASGERTAKALEPIPSAIQALTTGLQSAGNGVRTGAEAASASYRELIDLQKLWFAGAETGLNAMKDQLQSIIGSYGNQIQGQTSMLMKLWTEEVEKCLVSYSSQLEEIQGGFEEIQSAISRLRS